MVLTGNEKIILRRSLKNQIEALKIERSSLKHSFENGLNHFTLNDFNRKYINMSNDIIMLYGILVQLP